MKGKAPGKVEFAVNTVDTFRGSAERKSSSSARRYHERQEEKGVEKSYFCNDSGSEGTDFIMEHPFIRTALLG